jgi:hypothetical protein
MKKPVARGGAKRTPAKKTRRAPAHLPEPRGRRGHAKVDDDANLRAWLMEALQRRPAPTLDELVEESRGLGFSIGRTAIYAFRVGFEAERARRALVFDLAEEYNASNPTEHVLEIETAISTMSSARIFQQLLQSGVIDDKATALIELHRKLQTSSSNRERTRMFIDRGTRTAILRLRGELLDALKDEDRDVQRRVLAALDRAAAEIRE